MSVLVVTINFPGKGNYTSFTGTMVTHSGDMASVEIDGETLNCMGYYRVVREGADRGRVGAWDGSGDRWWCHCVPEGAAGKYALSCGLSVCSLCGASRPETQAGDTGLG